MSLAVDTWGKGSPIRSWIDGLAEKASTPQESGMAHKNDQVRRRGRNPLIEDAINGLDVAEAKTVRQFESFLAHPSHGDDT